MVVTVYGYPTLISTGFLRFYFSIFYFVLVSIKKTSPTIKTVFNHISKHLEVRQLYFAASRIVPSR